VKPVGAGALLEEVEPVESGPLLKVCENVTKEISRKCSRKARLGAIELCILKIVDFGCMVTFLVIRTLLIKKL